MSVAVLKPTYSVVSACYTHTLPPSFSTRTLPAKMLNPLKKTHFLEKCLLASSKEHTPNRALGCNPVDTTFQVKQPLHRKNHFEDKRRGRECLGLGMWVCGEGERSYNWRVYWCTYVIQAQYRVWSTGENAEVFEACVFGCRVWKGRCVD